MSPLVLLILAFVTGYNCELDIRHGNAYGFMSVSEGYYLTSQQHKFRARIGVNVGPVLLKEFSGASNQYFELIHFSSKDNTVQYWPFARQYPLNELTVQPNAGTEQPLPLKNLVEFIETSANSKRFVIKSVDLQKCVHVQGKDQPINYVECDVDDETQQFLSVASFLSRGESNWHSEDVNENSF